MYPGGYLQKLQAYLQKQHKRMFMIFSLIVVQLSMLKSSGRVLLHKSIVVHGTMRAIVVHQILVFMKIDIWASLISYSTKAPKFLEYSLLSKILCILKLATEITTIFYIREALSVAKVVAAMIALFIILLLEVLGWDDCLSEILAWDTLAWFVVLEWAWPGN
ncbi:hypothetical protein FEM48_Zijuj01G0179500 [Ziziphus jujuba var. spinosa]|uniref:Uncharacterized protein n=1 Tax=Ziziphus jujuba var. spinosa TaxID=714518 RepID=A0A978W2Q7_ZIZJJ|nr:hypothetical protein FEM48_Zijuj01G0179500 [Ziziphus jujuba var. spinosa]